MWKEAEADRQTWGCLYPFAPLGTKPFCQNMNLRLPLTTRGSLRQIICFGRHASRDQ